MSIRNAQTLTVRRRPGASTKGILQIGDRMLSCALGRCGITRLKREGDGATPGGRMAVLYGFYRADRIRRPKSHLPLRPIRTTDAWCDAVGNRNYNRPVQLPYAASHETMSRADALYDIVIVLDWNVTRRSQGRGSAIFLHLARPGYPPTEGCVAVSRRDMIHLLAKLQPGSTMEVA